MEALDSDPAVERLLADVRPRTALAPPRRELLAELGGALALLAACAGMAAAFGIGHWPSIPVLVALVAAQMVAGRVRFDVGAGYTTPTEVVLVPILFAVPPAGAPLVVVACALLRRLPEVFDRRVHPSRLVVCVPDAWHAVGPALVLAVAGHPAASMRHWPLYVAAFGAQVVFDLGTGILREWLALGVAPSLQLRLFALVTGADAALAPVGLLAAIAMREAPDALLCLLPLIGLLAHFARERDQRIRSALQLSSAYRGTALLMGDVLEADDPYTGGEHSQGVVGLALAVGEELGLSSRAQRDLEFGSLLHDIGKLRVSNDIINKPGKLTEEEWEIVRRHPVDGQKMLERVGGTLAEIGKIVRAHHERVDGGGYPDGLAGDEIPLEARIICACDAYSAMTTTRSYRKAMPQEVALAELRRCAGQQFDARVVDAIVRVVERTAPAPVEPPAVPVAA
jgi:HD-GYP domain-containing protein (c-di-GMP phosphodiesterase class II)